MDIPGVTSQKLFDEQGDLIVNVACRRCAYNLRGLRQDGRCPECGTPVGRSTSGDLLQYSDPSWVGKLARGGNLILWGTGLVIIGELAEVVLRVAAGSTVSVVVLCFPGELVAFCGTWLLTERDPSHIGEDVYGTVRKLVRVTLLISLASSGLAIISDAVALPEALAVALGLILVASGPFAVVGEFCRLYYLAKIARRIPNDSLERRANFLKWAMSISLLVLILSSALEVAAVLASAGTGAVTSGVVRSITYVSGLAGLVMFVFLLVYLRMLYRFRQAFREKVEIARNIWAGSPQRSGATT